jgi:transcriptional regulator with XRE-family HTH domain
MNDGPDGIDAARELAGFLRGRRERLSPDMVGLPPRRTGRTPGLRREEVAQLASVSTDYITRLEQARGLRPSAEVIDALARALRLDDDETAYLYGLAGHALPTRPTAQDTIGSLTDLVTALSPLPAMLVDDHFDIHAWNPEMNALMLDFADVPPAQRNTIWLCAMHPAMPAYYRDRERIMREGIADLRAAWAKRPEDTALAELVHTLRGDRQRRLRASVGTA